MILTNRQVIQVFESLYQIKQSNIQLPFKLSFTLTKNYKELEDLYCIIVEHKKNIYLKYGQTQNNQIIIEQDKVPEYTKEINEFLDIQNTVNITKLKLDDFNDTIQLSIEMMEGLYEIIDD